MDCRNQFGDGKGCTVPALGRIVPFLLVLCAFLVAAPFGLMVFASAEAQESRIPFKLVRVTPSGEDVPPGNQIVLEFSRPVVPLGRMERDALEVPVTIEPRLDCQWRWLNASTLSCRLDDKKGLVPSTTYRVTVGTALTTLDGIKLAAAASHAFTTQRVKAEATWFKTWVSPGGPRIGIRFNQPVDVNSVAAHVYFQGPKHGRIAARVEKDPDRRTSESDPEDTQWVVSPREELPPDQESALRVEPGIRSLRGPELSVDQRALLTFLTFPPFKFLGVECDTNSGSTVLITPGQPLSAQPKCNPEGGTSLKFSAPVMPEGFRKALQIEPNVTSTLGDDISEDGFNAYSRLSELREKGTTYSITFPWRSLKPFTQYRVQIAKGALKDEFGRSLVQAADIQFATDHRLPDYALLKEMPVLEKDLDTDVAFLATNLSQMKLSYQTTTARGARPAQSKVYPLPRAQDKTLPIALGIRDLLGAPSGFVKGQLTSQPPLPNKEPSEGWFFAQVTPFHVHAKIGYHNTLVWVTDLKWGKPVSGVRVQIVKGLLKDPAGKSSSLAAGVTRDDGTLELPGLSTVDPELKALHAYEPEEQKLFIRCEKGEDVALLPLHYDFQVASEGANREYISEWLRPLHGHIRAWGATAQGIYKVGDTVQFKIYVRDQGNRSFVQAPKGDYILKVMDPTDKVVHLKEGLRLSSFGAFDGEFAIPSNGAVGWYRFQLTASFTDEEWEPMRVLVSDFTPSPFKVTTDLSPGIVESGDTLKVETTAKLHAGGPYAGGDVRVAAMVESKPFSPENAKAQGFQFDVTLPGGEEAGEEGGESEGEVETPASNTIFQTDGRLNDKGNLETEFTVAATQVIFGKLTVESAVRDERGKSVASRSSAVYAGRDRYVGLSQGDWLLQQNKTATVKVLVVDRDGNPVPGVPVQMRVERKETKASRVKGAGDAYVTEYVHEWLDESSADLNSSEEPIVWEFTPKRSGSIRIVASIKDTKGRSHKTTMHRWVSGESFVLWESIPGNLLDVHPEKKQYRVGETARFMVQNPFPGARALITVERYGVIQSWVKVFNASTEIVEVTVDPDHLPGFYLSVMVMSPRVERAQENDTEDLGKPTFRMGYAEIEVKDVTREISVTITPDRDEYRPRETVTLDFDAQPRYLASGERRPPMELAVAVLDESVFDLLLKGRSAFDPYEGFYRLDSLDLANYNLLMQLVGRQKLEKKGADAGGGGGPDLGLRSVFKFLSYWNPSLPVDDQGRARIQFQVPDNLTGWRVLAMAVTPTDRMGLGEKVFRVNQPTEIRPVLPNQVLEGDAFEAGFSIMNRTAGPRNLDVHIQAEGAIESARGETVQSMTRQVMLEPFKRIVIRFPLKAGPPGRIVLTAQAGDATDKDGLKQEMPVRERQTQEVASAYGTTVAGEVAEALVFPLDMRPGVGKIDVTATPSVLGNMQGAFEYMRRYPYTCWEQMLTRALMAAFYQQLKPYVGASFAWEESAGIPGQMLKLAMEHQAPSGGMAYYLPKDEYADPYLSAFTALGFSWLKELGHAVPKEVERKLHEYLQTVMRKEVTGGVYTQGMLSSVRALILAVQAQMGKVTQGDLDRYRVRVPEMSLFGKAFFLQALTHVPGTARLQESVLKSILAQGDQSGGTLVFKETLDSRFKHILSSSLRDNSAVLLAMLAVERKSPGQMGVGDIPFRMVRSIVQSRKTRTHWNSTQDNLFAVKALVDFSRTYEKGPVDFRVLAELDGETLGEAVFKSLADSPRTFDRPLKPEDVGKKASIRLSRTGEGRLYYGVNLRYTPKALQTDATNAGVEVHREYSVERNGKWVQLSNEMDMKTGDLVRVDIYVNVPAERYFVVVNDPIPGGLEPVNRDLATASTVDADKSEATIPAGSYRQRYRDWVTFASSRWSFYHRELRHDSARFYSELLPQGRYHLSYVAQAIAPGTFTVLPTMAEEMYTPDVFGRGVPATLRVQATE